MHFLACLPDSKKAQDYGKQADDNDICGSFGYAVREPETLNSDAMWNHLASDREWQYLWGAV